MQHVSDKQYQCSGMGNLTRYAAVFTGWRRLCLLTVLLCGVATLAAADTHDSGITPAPVLGDLNGDGRDDVLLRHTDGRWFYYPMDGRNHITDQRGYADLTRNLDWQFAGMGDLNGDGKDDVLLRHTDGRWDYYPMDGRNPIADERGLAGLTRNLDWHVAGIGDLNGDGKDDVLLRNKNGRWYYYPMNGRRYITDARGYADLTRDLDWQVAGIGDLNGDGRDDVLLRHTDGRWDYYPMDGRNPIADERGLAGLTRNLAWQVVGMGDLNGDGKDDVLLRHTDSRWYYYPMDGRRYITDERGYAGLTRNLDWQVAGIGDLNGDGRDDVLLRHTDSRWYYYPMDGRNYLADERGYANLTRNADWSIADTDTLAPTGAPDLVVESPAVSDSMLNTGDSFTLNATVRNRGAGRADATTLRYYRSSDSTISSSDTPAGTDAVGGLAASGSDDKSTTLTAPSSAGTYYYGACVESVSGESDTGNNCSSGVSVTVSDSQVDGSATRYAVGDVVTTLPTGTWTPDVTSGGSFSLSGGNSVLNLGNGGYIEEGGSRYTCESTGGCEVRNREVLAGTIVETPSGGGTPLPSDDHGDTRAGASPLALNASTSGRIEHGSDVDYFSVQVSGSRTLTVYTTGSLDTTGELQSSSGSVLASNDDGGSGTNFRIEREVSSGTYYIKVESYGSNTGSYTLHAEFSSSGGGGACTAGLVVNPGESCTYKGNTFSVSASGRGSIAFFSAGSSIDARGSTINGESWNFYASRNSGSNSWTIHNVEDPPPTGAPDLVVESPSVSDSTLNTGDSFTLNATVRNRGTGRSDATTLRYYRSSNSTISSSDTQAGTDAVGALSASGTSAESISLTAPSNAGTYYYGACVESVSGESDTGNNCSTGVRVTVSSSGGGGGACTAGLVVNPGESCTYKGNTFSVSTSGRGSIAFFSAGSSIDARGSTINGVSWNFYASKNSGSNSWTIHDAD